MKPVYPGPSSAKDSCAPIYAVHIDDGKSRAERAREEIEKRFTYQPPKPGQPERYSEIRAKVKELALFIHDNTPSSREQSSALTNLDQVVFWANASIARHE